MCENINGISNSLCITVPIWIVKIVLILGFIFAPLEMLTPIVGRVSTEEREYAQHFYETTLSSLLQEVSGNNYKSYFFHKHVKYRIIFGNRLYYQTVLRPIYTVSSLYTQVYNIFDVVTYSEEDISDISNVILMSDFFTFTTGARLFQWEIKHSINSESDISQIGGMIAISIATEMIVFRLLLFIFQILTVNGLPFSKQNFLVDAETLSIELQKLGIDIYIDTVDNNLVLIPRSIDLRHTTEITLWGNWLNANYGTVQHNLDEGQVVQQNDSLSFQFNYTNTLGAYTFTRRIVDERGPVYAELYSGTYWIDSDNILHLHYRYLLNNEGEVIQLLDLQQQWLFEWAFTNAINLWQEESPENIIQLQRVGLP